MLAWVKKYALWLCLAITMVLVVLAKQQEMEDDIAIVPVTSREVQQKTMMLSPVIEQGSLFRTEIIDTPRNLFAIPQAEKPVITTQPVTQKIVPHNPYHYAGKLSENGQTAVFLTDGRKNYVARLGDVLDGEWRVESLHGTQMTLRNIPTDVTVSLNIGASL